MNDEPSIEKVNLSEKFALFQDYWNPRVVGEVGEMQVKLAKLKGEFVWHQHEHEDEMFLVVKGRLLLKFRDGDVYLDEGEFLVVPRGVEHMPVAEEEVHLMMLEPSTTLNTGNLRNERTRDELERL